MKTRPSAANMSASRSRPYPTNGRAGQPNGDDRANDMDVDDGPYGFDDGDYEGRLYSDEMVGHRPRYRD